MTTTVRDIPETAPSRELLGRQGDLLGLSVGRQGHPSEIDGFARRFAAACLNCDPAAIALRHDRNGQPVLETVAGQPFLSLSHSGPLTLAGLATRPIGVDLEHLGEPREPAWNVLHPGERNRLSAIEDSDARHQAFIRLWTAKEAWVKALGEGFRREPSSFEIRPEDSGSFSVHDPVTSSAPVLAATGSFDAEGQTFLWSCVVI
jgi:phosphopantetheinyl transferase